MKTFPALALSAAMIVAACSGGTASNAAPADTASLDASGAQPATPLADAPFTVQEVAGFDEPWAMTFLPGGKQALGPLARREGRGVVAGDHDPRHAGRDQSSRA